MKHSFASLDQREKADLTVVPFWEGPLEAFELGDLKESLEPSLSIDDFKGKNGESVLIYPREGKEKRILLLGLGKQEKASAETLRRAYAAMVRTAFSKKAKGVNLLFPEHSTLSKEELLRGVADGIYLSNYAFNHLKRDTLKEAPPLLEKVCFIGLDKKEEKFLDKLQKIAEGVYLTRELVNGNADDVTSQTLADTALSLEKISPQLKTSVYDKKWLAQKKMGLILAVNRASIHDPFLIEVSYKGNPKSKEHIVLVGKGVTFDTGGLCLKTADGIVVQKADMAGAATVLGAVHAAASLGLKVNVTALVPAVENSIGSKSYKPGDVYRSYSGKTIEVNNTDAEGRLILADAISYAVQDLAPSCLIDLATLTGNIILALGEEMTGFYSNNENLAQELKKASEKTGEAVWRMPLYPDYRDSLKSDIADLQNTGGREAGSIKAALFLNEFVGSTPWMHLDIAGPAFLTKPRHYYPTKGTGYGVRLLVEFLESKSV